MKLGLFSPESFDNDPYGHLTNQISHIALSLLIVYWMPFAWLVLALFWFVWETWHFIQSDNVIDFFEDLFFECSGILIYFFPLWSLFSVVVLAFTTFKRIK